MSRHTMMHVLAIATFVVAIALAGPTVAAAPPSTEPPSTEPTEPPTDTEPTDTEPPPECEERVAETLTDVPWQQQRLQFERTWQFADGRGVVVAVVDSGVDASVPQLDSRVEPGLDVVNGGGGADTDCDGHGTFVAGIIAAAADSDTSFVGVAPRAVILPVRQANDREDGDSRGMSEAIVYAVDNGASVINVSASATRDDPELAAAVEYAEHNDVLVVAALSNDAENGNPSSYPAAYPTVISVGSVDASGRRSSFSETGEGIDLVAPGEDVVSVAAGTSGHAALSGTSFATPFVSGVAALIRSAHPELDVAEVRHRLLVTADHPGRDRPDDELGWGLVNPFRAVTAVIPTEPTSAPAGDAIDLASPTSDTTGSLPNATSRLLVGLVLFAALFATVLTVAQAARRPRTAAVLPAQTTTRHGGPTP